MNTSVTVAAGQAAKDTVFHLTPGGNLSGRITGANGEPLVGIEVTLLHRG